MDLARAGMYEELVESNVVEATTGVAYDIVIHNAPAANGRIEQHPWHMHGYHFWVLGWGPGVFDYETHR